MNQAIPTKIYHDSFLGNVTQVVVWRLDRLGRTETLVPFEREVIAERILAGQAVARANGKTWGGRKAGTRIKVTDEQVQTIRRLNSEGTNKSAIARATYTSCHRIQSHQKEV